MAKFKKQKASKKSLNKHNDKINKRVEFITRTKAIRKLQISSVEFRRLCIVKGIYPQIPPNKKFQKNKIYYFKREINDINREPVLNKIRELNTYNKKKKHLKNKNNQEKLTNLKLRKPVVELTHLVKERYPTFKDALADLNDPLSLISLFRVLPDRKLKGFTPKMAGKISKLYFQFLRVMVHRRALRKTFISLKGVYLQVEIDGQFITWIVPHRLIQTIPEKIDYLSLTTFIQFYSELLKFVNFKLYKENGLFYPPKDISNETKFLSDFSLAETECQKMTDESPENTKNDLFNGLTFLLMPETFIEILSFIIASFGGRFVIESEIKDEEREEIMKTITHEIMDRFVSEGKDKSRENFETVQPQWIFDCVNKKELVPVDLYAPGMICPDHLSPFVEEGEKIAGEEDKIDLFKKQGEPIDKERRLDFMALSSTRRRRIENLQREKAKLQRISKLVSEKKSKLRLK